MAEKLIHTIPVRLGDVDMKVLGQKSIDDDRPESWLIRKAIREYYSELYPRKKSSSNRYN